MELESGYSELKRKGLGIAAISYDSVAILRHFAQRRNITFPLLSDEDSKVIRAFGILNESVPRTNAFYGIPHPVTLILDPNGVVKEKQFEEDYRQRYTLGSTLIREFGVEPASAKGEVAGKRVRVVTSASTATVHPGQRISLVLDFELPPGLHVYAPGVDGYLPVAWNLTPAGAYTEHPVDYPPSRTLHLPAINETVPVYEKKIRLIRDLTIGNDRKPKEIPVNGTFRYQACDDRLCYPPETVPVKWNLTLEPLDAERVPADLQRRKP